MRNKLETHQDYNALYMRSISNYRKQRQYGLARLVMSQLKLIRKLQKQCGVK